MPARKKARVESQSASTPSVATLAAEEKALEKAEQDAPELDPELWTDEQEIALFKGMIKWKPVGMHKHLRMIALSQHMRSHGHREQHTRPQGIWRKLGSLYNLKTLDEREDAFGEVGSDDVDTLRERYYCPFKLPEDDFGDMMFDRRLEKHKSTSPAAMSSVAEGRASTVDDTEEPRSSPATSSVRGGRAASKRGRGTTKVPVRGRSKLQIESTQAKPEPEPEPSEEEEEEDEEAEEESEEEDEEDEEDEEEDGNDAPTPRGSRGRGRGRGRGGGRAGRRAARKR